MNDSIKNKIDKKFEDYSFHSAIYLFSEEDDNIYNEDDVRIIKDEEEYNNFREKELYYSCALLFEYDIINERFTPSFLDGQDFILRFDISKKNYYIHYKNIFVEKRLFKYLFDGFDLYDKNNVLRRNLISEYLSENQDIYFAIAYIVMPMIEFYKYFDEEEKEYVFKEVYYPKETFIVFYK